MNTPSPLSRINWFADLARPLFLAFVLLITMFMVACASTPVPNAKMAVAEAAVKHASSTDTSEHAPGQLQVAIAKLASAQDAFARKDYALAYRRADEAELDAQVAIVHARAVRATKSAKETQDAARVLRDEIDRKSAY